MSQITNERGIRLSPLGLGKLVSTEPSAALTGQEGVASRSAPWGYLAGLAAGNEVTVSLRYGTTGRPEQEFAATGRPSPDR